MKFDGVKKVDEGRVISRYDLYYTTEDDKKKVYEIISRNKDIKTLEDIRNENVTPSGSPALVNPIKIGIEEQEQNGVTVPSNAPIIFAQIPWNLPIIFLLLSGGK